MPEIFDRIKRRLKPSSSRSNLILGGAQPIQQSVSTSLQHGAANVSPPLSTNHPPSQSNASTLSTCTIGASSSSNKPSRSSTSPNLWVEALQTLPAKHRATIEHKTPSYSSSPQPASLSSMIEDLCSLTEQKRAECEKRGWKLEYNGQQVILRDMAEKVIVWLNKFKAVGDIAVNFDPIHFALPWAGIRFLLQVGHESQSTS